MRAPEGLQEGGAALWRDVLALVAEAPGELELNAFELVVLEEACRVKDRLDRLDGVIREGAAFGVAGSVRMVVGDSLGEARQQGDLLKKLLAAIRLPDPRNGKRPQRRGPRGVQRPSVPGGRGR